MDNTSDSNEEYQSSTRDLLFAAFRAAFTASVPRSSVFSSVDGRRDLVLHAAKEATQRLVGDLRQMGHRPDIFPVDDAQKFIEEIIGGLRVVPGLGKIAADNMYAGILASVPRPSE